jgi:hypothetical protein
MMEEKKNAYKISLENPKGKRPNEGPRRRSEVKVYSEETKCRLDSNGSEHGQGRDLVSAVMNAGFHTR